MKIGCVQFRPVFGDVESNVAAMESLVAGADADLLVLPELATTGYTFISREETNRLSEPFESSPSLDRLQAAARKRSCALVLGFAERASNGALYNSAALLRPDGTRELYRKIHLFGTETLVFEPGDIPFAVHDVRGVKIGMLVCFDWIFPESMRVLALKGGQVLCQPANLVLQWCQRAMVIRSIENRVFTVTANRYGVENRGDYSFAFTGGSQVTSPLGDVLALAPDEGDAVKVVEIDPSTALNKDITAYNNLFGDRRPEFYGDIANQAND